MWESFLKCRDHLLGCVHAVNVESVVDQQLRNRHAMTTAEVQDRTGFPACSGTSASACRCGIRACARSTARQRFAPCAHYSRANERIPPAHEFFSRFLIAI